MGNIFDKEEEIFQKWREIRTHFVADGVTDEVKYISEKIKTLFLLKEVNDPNGGGWDLRESLQKRARPTTWNNIARWVYGIRNLGEKINWVDIENITSQFRKEMLSYICAVNLKKTPGGYVTNVNELYKTSTEDKELLLKQLSLYEPDLIICCGSAVTKIIGVISYPIEKPSWQRTKRGVWYFQFAYNKYVISYSHPEARVSSNLLFYGLYDALLEIRGHLK